MAIEKNQHHSTFRSKKILNAKRNAGIQKAGKKTQIAAIMETVHNATVVNNNQCCPQFYLKGSRCTIIHKRPVDWTCVEPVDRARRLYGAMWAGVGSRSLT